MNDDKVIELLKKLSLLLKERPSYGIRSSDKIGLVVIKRLKMLSRELHKALPEDLKEHYRPEFSKGKSSLPRVLWVSLCPRRRAVYNSMSVTICFSFNGDGFVFGVIDSVTIPQRWLPTVQRQKNEITVDVNAVNYKYNDVFHNPQEMQIDSLDLNVLRSHVIESSYILHKEILNRFPLINL